MFCRTSTNKPVNKPTSAKPKLSGTSSSLSPGSPSHSSVSPPRPHTSSSEALGRCKGRGEDSRSKSRAEAEAGSGGEDKSGPPPIVPRHAQPTIPVKGWFTTYFCECMVKKI